MSSAKLLLARGSEKLKGACFDDDWPTASPRGPGLRASPGQHTRLWTACRVWLKAWDRAQMKAQHQAKPCTCGILKGI